jgi:hypothetical protein
MPQRLQLPIDATPQEAVTSGNQFVLRGDEWHFNLDTKATGLTKGIWQLIATLSDGTEHTVWIQGKVGASITLLDDNTSAPVWDLISRPACLVWQLQPSGSSEAHD